MYAHRELFTETLNTIEKDGTFKEERVITSPQSTVIRLSDGSDVINFCANNYLGLANNPEIIESAKRALDTYGYGMSSVRFICGTLDIHKKLENMVAEFLGMEETVLYSSCFDANTGLFETILTGDDVVISDELNHASIIDGIRLCKAHRMIYRNNDMNHLKQCLEQAGDFRIKLIATDGVFSMDGSLANLKDLCDLADTYEALVMVDDSHGTGVIGKTGRGSLEVQDVIGRIDIVTGTFGKALGGATGGFVTTRKEIATLLRQKSRPYLFSNTMSPVQVSASIKALEMINESTELLDRLNRNTCLFSDSMRKAGFTLPDGIHPIVPIMYGEAQRASRTAKALLEEGIYVIAFSYPVVPRGAARIRVQISAAHTEEQIDKAVQSFKRMKN